jgi:hypothetical protein
MIPSPGTKLLIVVWTLLHLCFAEWSFSATRKEQKYNIAEVASLISKNTRSITRLRSVRWKVKDEGHAVLQVTHAVTIFNREARLRGIFPIWYDKFTEIEEFEGALYNAQGELIRELSSKDIKDYSAYEDYNLYADTRVRFAELYSDTYPYTVECSYEISYDGFISWPKWYDRESGDAVEHSRFEVVVPTDKPLRYWCNRDSVKPVMTNDDNLTYVWEAHHLPKIDANSFDEVEDIATIVLIAPTEFIIDKRRGSMASWQEFGKWIYSLYTDKNKLPDAAIKDVRKFVDSTLAKRELVARLYKYMQSRTRYVSVQLGIGGWEPYNATYVHDHGYGDCKALTNYMASLLNEVGIPSYPVVIQLGENPLPLLSDFPNGQFNHAILCLPLEQDTIWLECTSQTLPFGVVHSGIENKDALLLTPNGGCIVRLPTSTALQNTRSRVANVVLDKSASHASIVMSFKGNQLVDVNGALSTKSPSEIQAWIAEKFKTPDIKINHYDLQGIENRDTTITLKVEISLGRHITSTGNRIFFYPSLIGRRTSAPPSIERHLSPIRFEYPYQDIDSIVYHIPKFYRCEALPKETKISCSFGEFRAKSVVVGDSVICYTRKTTIYDRIVPASQYLEYKNFFTDIFKADQAQVVLVFKL